MVNLLLLLLACADEPAAPVEAPVALSASAIPTRDAAGQLIRRSLDLRGVMPTPDELAAVEADPAALDTLTEEFLADPRFEGRVRALYSEILLTQADSWSLSAQAVGVDDAVAFATSIGEEPLRIVGAVAAQDLPWTTVVTADWTMANETTAAMWPLDYPAGATGWQQARYTDGRPPAGLLSTNGLWWRYRSTDSNANRKRANAISRIFLCNDYLVRPITFDRNLDLMDEAAVADAVHNNPDCVSCHVSLDPVAAYLFGFWAFDDTSPIEMRAYHPEREHLYDSFLGVGPAYYGQPGQSLADLGQQIAGDNRFPECAVQQVYGALLRRKVGLDDADALSSHREAFLAGGLTLKSLIRSVVADPRYAAAEVDDASAEAFGAATLKMKTIDLLESSVAGLTGFTWTTGGLPLLHNDTVGLRTLGGGVDGLTVTESATSPSATILLVQERLAQAAADFVVRSDAALPAGERRLLRRIELSATLESDSAAIAAQIVDLHREIFGATVQADGPEVTANLELWGALYAAEGDTAEAWTGLLAALLRDPDFLFY